MIATLRNMETLYPKHGNNLVWWYEGDETSANPGDYFMVTDPDEDLGGELMVRGGTVFREPEL